MNLVIKDGTSAEKNFIFSSWIKCYLRTVEADLWGKQAATAWLHAYITKLFDSGVEVAYVGDDETDEIYSYVVFNRKLRRIYFGYTKSIYRKDKLFDRLMLANNLLGFEFLFIFNGETTRALAQKYQLTYNPLGR
jgi:hypothetical protein